MRIIAAVCVFSSLAGTACSPQSDSETVSDCLSRTYQRYSQARGAWQRGVTDLIIQEDPSLSEVAGLYRDDQLRRIEAGLEAVRYFAVRAPERLRHTRPLHEWLDLSESDRQQISREVEAFGELQKKIGEFRDQSGHPQGDRLRALVAQTLMGSDSYQRLLDQLEEATRRLNSVECDPVGPG